MSTVLFRSLVNPHFYAFVYYNDLIWSVLFRYIRSAHSRSKPSLYRCVIDERKTIVKYGF